MSITYRATMLSSCWIAAVAAAGLALDATAQPALDTIEVHGVKDSLLGEQALTPGGVSLIDAESFARRPVNNMADSLRYVPGVWVESGTGGDAMFMSSRGSNLDATDYDNNGIKLLLDGLPVTAADGNNHNRFMDPLAARYAIVARGANALTYGASTLGGAIDFVSTTARDATGYELSVQGGSFGTLSGRLTAGGVDGALDGQVTLEGRDREGYREHSRQRRFGVYANAGWQLDDDLDLRLYVTHVDNEEELAGALTRAQFNADPRQANPSAISGHFQWNVRSSRVASRGSWRINDSSRLELGLSYEDQALYHPIVDKVMVGNPPVEVFSLLKETDQRTLGGMLRYAIVFGAHDVLAGVNVADTREEGGNHRNDRGLRNGQTGIIDNRSDSVEVFLVDRWSITPEWTLVYGAQGVYTGRDVRQFDLASRQLRNPRRDYSALNPRLGVIRALDAHGEWYASLSRLFEAPTTFQMEDDVRGNDATLDPMHGVVVETGLRGRAALARQASYWHWDVSLYYARIRDEILSVDDPATPGTSLATNIDRTVHAGVEALVGASLAWGAHRIEPLLSATVNHFVFDDHPLYGSNALPAAPDYALRGELMYRHSGGFFAGPTFDVVGERYADFSNSYRIGRYGLMGLRAGFERADWTLYAEVANLFNRHYVGALAVRDRASAGDALLQPGTPRAIHVGLRTRF